VGFLKKGEFVETETLEKSFQVVVQADKEEESKVFVHPWFWHPLSDELLEAAFKMKMAGFLREKNGVLCLTERDV